MKEPGHTCRLSFLPFRLPALSAPGIVLYLKRCGAGEDWVPCRVYMVRLSGFALIAGLFPKAWKLETCLSLYQPILLDSDRQIQNV